jgi:glucose/mannose-6-phosphate isomerase
MATANDPLNVLGSIKAMPDQVLHAFEDAQRIRVPAHYQEATALVCCGMGGSGLGGRFIETVYAQELKIPLIRVHGYHLPASVGKHSLVICSAYSGTTEEPLWAWDEALRRDAMLLAISTGSTLVEKAKQAAMPYYQIDPKHNPSGQPRMAVGYSITGQLVMAAKAGLIMLGRKEIDGAVAAMRRAQEREEEARAIAAKAKGRVVLFAAAEHLVGPAHTTNNQFNENAKTLTFDFAIPELNHHLLEGLKYPPSNKGSVLIVLIDSPSYDPRNRKRLRITAEVAEQNGIPTVTHLVEQGTPLEEGLALIQFGAYANYHLSQGYGQDPAPIPFVDYFKKRMAER